MQSSVPTRPRRPPSFRGWEQLRPSRFPLAGLPGCRVPSVSGGTHNSGDVARGFFWAHKLGLCSPGRSHVAELHPWPQFFFLDLVFLTEVTISWRHGSHRTMASEWPVLQIIVGHQVSVHNKSVLSWTVLVSVLYSHQGKGMLCCR